MQTDLPLAAQAAPGAGRVVLVLGDQLSLGLSSLREASRDHDVVLMAEVQAETEYAWHHKKKLAFVFSAMRHFARQLRRAGWRVDYRRIEETGAGGTLAGELLAGVRRHGARGAVITEPGEWRVRQDLQEACRIHGVSLAWCEDDRFLCTAAEFARWAGQRRELRMEYFYRAMRRRTGLLMDGEAPAGGEWNFDRSNRQAALPGTRFPAPLRFTPDAITREVLDLVDARFAGHFGTLRPFGFAVTGDDARQALDHFIEQSLPGFGQTQDAMLQGEAFLHHSMLSVYLNAGLLEPLEACRRVEEAYRCGRAPIEAAEGFIRQVLGWREYVRGIYWMRMPGYAAENYFGHTRALPEFYWTGRTHMACLRAALSQTISEAYAHHIQRLMLTGNFALLAGVSPQELHRWYLAVYADAYEWVELPNTLGMSQYADGGLLASKPYISSGAYVNRMSDHCGNCRYDVKDATGPRACPFNALFWDFLGRHRDKLAHNRRLRPILAGWDAMVPDRRIELQGKAAAILRQLDVPGEDGSL